MFCCCECEGFHAIVYSMHVCLRLSISSFLSFSSHRFGGSVNHDPHLLYTLSALQILALVDRLDLLEDGVGEGGRKRVAKYVGSLQQPDGSFAGDQWGKKMYTILLCLYLCARTVM